MKLYELIQDWYTLQSRAWTKGYARNVRGHMDKDILPALGHRECQRLKAAHILDMLRKIENRGAPATARKCLSILRLALQHGVIMGHVNTNPAQGLEAALAPTKTVHQTSVSPEELPDFMAALEAADIKRYEYVAAQLLLNTFVRPSELRLATWDEVDLDMHRWIIPADRMKMNADHIVPLSSQVERILRSLKDGRSEYVLRSPVNRHRPVHGNVFRFAIDRAGYAGKHTPHGCRALARTILCEELGYDPQVIERQLAHKPRGSLGSAYDRAQFIEQRKQMMQDWSDYLMKIGIEGEKPLDHIMACC